MAIMTSAGTTIGVTALKPASFDAAGYLALTFTPVGEITSAGEFGREWEKAEHKPLAGRSTTKKKAGFDDGQMQLQLGLDERDAGQAILQAAQNSDADFYFCMTLQNGDRYFLPAQVTGFKLNVGDRSGITTAACALEVTTANLTGIVFLAFGEVPAPSYAPALDHSDARNSQFL